MAIPRVIWVFFAVYPDKHGTSDSLGEVYNNMEKKICSCGAEFRPYYVNGILASKLCLKCIIAKEKPKKTKWAKKGRKKTPLENKENIAWGWFSKWLRLSSSKKGFCTCYTCGAIKHWKDTDAGHYIKRQHKALMFDERNVKPQCKKCNQFEGGRQDDFAVHLIKDYGEGILQELDRIKWQYYKQPTMEDLKALRDKYHEKFKALTIWN